MASKASKIWKRTWVGGTLAAAVALVLWLAFRSETGLVVWSVGVVFAFGAVFEVTRMTKLAGRGSGSVLFLALAAVSLPGALHFLGQDARGVLAFDHRAAVVQSYALTLVLAGVGAALLARRQLFFLIFCALWLFVPLPALWNIWSDFGPKGLTALLLLSKLGDVLGYYVGNAIGKSHPFPSISPGKTTAGCVASLIGGTLAGGACVAFGLLPGGMSAIWAGLIAGAIVNLAAQAGDLLESKVKRAAQVKDSGTWFGPSGGVLDLVDSLLLSVPAALCTWPWLFA